MIIKVPIYVDIDKIDADNLPNYVEACGKEFYLYLRKKNNKIFHETLQNEWGEDEYAPFPKIVSKDDAINFLRTGKEK